MKVSRFLFLVIPLHLHRLKENLTSMLVQKQQFGNSKIHIILAYFYVIGWAHLRKFLITLVYNWYINHDLHLSLFVRVHILSRKTKFPLFIKLKDIYDFFKLLHIHVKLKEIYYLKTNNICFVRFFGIPIYFISTVELWSSLKN